MKDSPLYMRYWLGTSMLTWTDECFVATLEKQVSMSSCRAPLLTLFGPDCSMVRYSTTVCIQCQGPFGFTSYFQVKEKKEGFLCGCDVHYLLYLETPERHYF
ncbi:hypothetical protein Hdeb2414_s0027g00694411 [Helianthus debilis subsp. tardiflorus]